MFSGSICRPPPQPSPTRGEGVDYRYRGKSLLLKLPRELNSFQIAPLGLILEAIFEDGPNCDKSIAPANFFAFVVIAAAV